MTFDDTTAQAVEGLSAIDDYGWLENGVSDPEANASPGTGGRMTINVTLDEPANSPTDAFVRADGVVATGQLGTNPDTPRSNLDGHEIFIFEDAELSGMLVTLHPADPTDTPYVISIGDLEINPPAPGASDDTMIAIDLDSLPGNPPQLVDYISIADDGLSRRGETTCESPPVPFITETAIEIDAVAVARHALRSAID